MGGMAPIVRGRDGRRWPPVARWWQRESFVVGCVLGSGGAAFLSLDASYAARLPSRAPQPTFLASLGLCAGRLVLSPDRGRSGCGDGAPAAGVAAAAEVARGGVADDGVDTAEEEVGGGPAHHLVAVGIE